MTSIDPSSAIWGYGFGRIVSEEEKGEIKETFRGKVVKDLQIKALKSENGELIIKLKNIGNATIGFDDTLDNPADVIFNKIVVHVYELLDKPIQEERKILGLLKYKKIIDKKEIFKTTLAGLKPKESVALRTDVVVDSKKRYKIVVEEHYEEYVRNWFKDFKGHELDETLKTLTISISAKSYEIIEDFCNEKSISIEDFLKRLIENAARQIQTSSSSN